MKKIIIDVTSGNQIEAEMSEEELANLLASVANEEAINAEEDARLESQRVALDSARSKLTALGLDEAEVNALLGL